MVVRAGLEQAVVAPADGRVSALHVTRGQTVLPDTLAPSLLPAAARFHAELFVPGRSIGMLDGSPRVQLRFDAYPFEKYGLYSAKIDRVADSLLLPGDARLPIPVVEPVYRVRAVLDQQHVDINGKRRRLTAGLTFKADILVSERSLLVSKLPITRIIIAHRRESLAICDRVIDLAERNPACAGPLESHA